MTAKAGKRKYRLFLPGQRIIRTVAAIFLCMLVYELRNRRGMPIFALIAAVMCIQPYNKDIKAIADRRIIGTLIGAAWGVLTLLLEQRLLGTPVPEGVPHYLIAALGAGAVIYFTVWLKHANMAQFAGIVYLIIVVTQTGSGNVFLYAYHRVVDTLIGIVVGELVNRVHLPRVRNTDILFASGITHTIFEEGNHPSGYSLIELNRLIEDGCKFTVDTIEAPASVRELLQNVNFQLPIIAMDGAVLYDLKERQFIRTVFMGGETAAAVCVLLDTHEVEFFMTTLDRQILIIRHGELNNEAIRDVYNRKRVSPYRNYAPRLPGGEDLDKIIYFFVMDRAEKVARVMAAIEEAPWSGRIRVREDDRQIPEGYRCIRIFPAEATKENMLHELQEMIGARETVTFGSEPGRYDVLIQNADRDLMVKELKRRFEPVSLKGWRNMFIRR